MFFKIAKYYKLFKMYMFMFIEDPDNSLPENASITTAVVKVRGSMNVMLTPLFLESFQRYDSMTSNSIDHEM